MMISHLTLKNWRNFQAVDVPLRERQFIVGANASGKSNLLDVFRFLRDIAKGTGGGLQKAIEDRGGVSKLRCLSARRDPEIAIGIWISNSVNDKIPLWGYEIGIKQETAGRRRPRISYERAWKGRRKVLDRPTKRDDKDKERQTQTFLEQTNENQKFREISRFLEQITYLHLVPQFLRRADDFKSKILEDDPFGQGFLTELANAHKNARQGHLNRIQKIVEIAVPQLKKITFEKDKAGNPHLKALYSHWRREAGWQQEDQFSDGTLRLIGLLWSLLNGDSLLLLEEPELSLHAGIVKRLAPLINNMQRKKKRPGKRQVLISTHSPAILSEEGIDGREVLMLQPSDEGTNVQVSSNIQEVRRELINREISVGEAVIPRTEPKDAHRMASFV